MKRSKLMGVGVVAMLLVGVALVVRPVPGVAEVELPTGFDAVGGVFVENVGQEPDGVLFAARGNGAGFFATASGVRIALLQAFAMETGLPVEFDDASVPVVEGVALELSFVDPNPAVVVRGANPVSTAVNVLRSDVEAVDLTAFGTVVYDDLWPGIDASFSLTGSTLKYAFHVAAGADPSAIGLGWDGVEAIRDLDDGGLAIDTVLGGLVDTAPQAWQEGLPVAIEYARGSDGSIGFLVVDHDPSRDLTIDPGLEYGTFVGGGQNDVVYTSAIDSAGAVYLGGYTTSVDFPTTTGAFQTTVLDRDGYVAKLVPGQPSLVFATYFGGSANEWVADLDIDEAGRVYVTGHTSSADLPVTVGAYDTSRNDTDDAYVAELSPDGTSLLYSTYLGGSVGQFGQRGSSILVAAPGEVYIGGETGSSDFPTTPGAYDRTKAGEMDAFLAHLHLAGDGPNDLVASTLIGGSSPAWSTEEIWSLEFDGEGRVVAAGGAVSWDFPTTPGAVDTTFNGQRDTFVSIFSSDLSGLVHSTWFGGSREESLNVGDHLSIGPDGSILITGGSTSVNLPTSADAVQPHYAGGCIWGSYCYEGFVARLNADLTSLDYATYLGGATGAEKASGMTVNALGVAFITGFTSSADYPTTPNAYDATLGGDYDSFVTVIDPTGSSLLYSTLLGGSDWDFGGSVDLPAEPGQLFTAGHTHSADFPVTADGLDTTFNGVTDAYLVRIEIPNTTPNADPGGPYLAQVGSDVALDGRGSRDYEGGPLSFEWTVEAGSIDDPFSSTPTYTAPSEPGIYDLSLTVTDEGALSDPTTTYVVVYDADGAFITGGGLIDSPPGALTANPAVTGKAIFGFMSRYHKGANTPTGNTQFRFNAGDLAFRSDSYDWLVVAGARAQFKGAGEINGVDGYRFFITAIDADQNTQDAFEVDRFRIKIWDASNDAIVYDNQVACGVTSATAEPCTEITHGSIRVQRG